MPHKKRIIAISGSTRASSSNLNLMRAMADLSKEIFDMILLDGLDNLPHYNPDLDQDNPPAEISDFRKKLKEADGILICTPEYAMGVPGTLKNAIDWTVSSMEFSHKPTALITASSLGHKGHASLMETLKIIEANITPETQLVIPHAKTKISQDNKITDTQTLLEVNALIDALHANLLIANS